MGRDRRGEVVAATGELLVALMAGNSVLAEDVISIVFTTTPDLTSEFPAAAARAHGLDDVPLLCATEIAVADAPQRCVRILMHLYTVLERSELKHVYLGGARGLRGDLTPPPDAQSGPGPGG